MTVLLDFPSGAISACDPVARAATDRLHENPELAGEFISCEYRQGMLVLRGRVPTYYQKRIAQEVVRRMDGVGQLVNEIDVARRADSIA
jgi:osmotically-inducible protein OsmY